MLSLDDMISSLSQMQKDIERLKENMPTGNSEARTFLSSGLMQDRNTRAILPSTWITTNLQLRDFPELFTDAQLAFIKLNSYCNATGTITGSTEPPAVFNTLGKTRVTSRVFAVEASRISPSGFKLSKTPIGKVHNLMGEKFPLVMCFRADKWDDIYEALALYAEEQRTFFKGA